MNVYAAIQEAEALLPGEPVAKGEDPRWQAILEISKYVETEPGAVWEFIGKWGSHPQEDLRTAIATCLLEHLLQYHFTSYFPQVADLTLVDPLFVDTFLRCWKFGQAEEPPNAERFQRLHDLLRKQSRV